ncbi:MAG TPA: hypothetical protein VH477_16515 [Bryobacteraceae bacterium]
MCEKLFNTGLNAKLPVVEGEGKTSRIGLGRRLLFWDFARASWQYDVVVGLILIFIFATPRDWFHDQPKASSVILMSSRNGINNVFIAPGLLEFVPDRLRPKRAEALIHERTGKRWHVARVEAIRDEAEHEIKGFIAYAAP